MLEGRLLIHGARQVVRVGALKQLYKTGDDMNQLHVVTAEAGSTGVSVAVDSSGLIAAIGLDEDIASTYSDCHFECTVSADGGVVLPGLVDAHTHPVWAGDRVHEFALKMAGASYLQVQEAGGGIHFTVAQTIGASDDLLLGLLQERMARMLRAGTTLAEMKSGYGLNAAQEVRLLSILHRAGAASPLTTVHTFLGAHAVPPGVDAEEAARLVVEEQLPAVLRARDRGENSVAAVDVFCESGVFSVDQTRRIAEAARQQGDLMVNLHVDELMPLDGAKMAGDLCAEAVSHCEEVSPEGMAALAAGGTVAVLLPTTQLLLGLRAPPAREMINSGVIVALGSDFNPNAYCLSMATVLHLACVLLRLSPAEALSAATINAAHSVRQAERRGALQPGMVADMILVEADRWEHLVYQLSEHHHLIRQVVCAGRVVHTRAPPLNLPSAAGTQTATQTGP